MNFGMVQANIFGTLEGSYSVVTDTEYDDGQVTLTGYERTMALEFFGEENIVRGAVSNNPSKAQKPFRLYPDGQIIYINMNFPKSKGRELRIYYKRHVFFPKNNDILFLFMKNNELWIGSCSKTEWELKSTIFKNDDHDYLYQELIQEDYEESNIITTHEIKSRTVISRNPRIARERMELSGYKCEYDINHKLFISRFKQKSYLEAHHLIPIGAQNNFSTPLDTPDNIFCLCPNCHRAIHFAEQKFC